MAETPAGMLNSIGLQNPGADYLIEKYSPYFAGLTTKVIVNISGNTVEEYAKLAAKLDGVPGIAGLEVNISCPNVKMGGMAFGADATSAAEVTRQLRGLQTCLPL
ncbi:hypothetical protein N752_14800 [Desulforamulus aquiferis]|nr:hypothetical protein N752_14800 [Desulforamulus aquiferis]